jgi:lipopolysaccharide export system protein LptA
MHPLLSASALSAVVIFGFAQARQQVDCVWEVVGLDPDRSARVRTLADGGSVWEQGGGVEATCGSTWIRADSVSLYEKLGVLDVLYLFGDVQYRDEGRSMSSEHATYYGAEDRIECEGNVQLTDEAGRSKLSADSLDYYPLNENRVSERIVARNRPHLTFYADTVGSGAAAPFEVDADLLYIHGDSAVAGVGSVEATRGDLEAYSDSMDLNLATGELWLLGESPRVEASEMLLQGDTILVLMIGNQVREIQSWPNASALGENLELDAPSLRLFVDGEEVARAVASAGDLARTGAVDSAGRAPWARSVSEEYSLVADSIDILRPGGRLEQVVASGRARANTFHPVAAADSTLAEDWLVGDTITGYFAAIDTSLVRGQTPALERLVAASSARALYHIVNAEQQMGTDRPAVNYVIGKVVTLFLVDGEVREAQVIGPSTGVYLEPVPAGAATDTSAVRADTTVVAPDTLRARADTTRTSRGKNEPR